MEHRYRETVYSSAAMLWHDELRPCEEPGVECVEHRGLCATPAMLLILDALISMQDDYDGRPEPEEGVVLDKLIRARDSAHKDSFLGFLFWTSRSCSLSLSALQPSTQLGESILHGQEEDLRSNGWLEESCWGLNHMVDNREACPDLGILHCQSDGLHEIPAQHIGLHPCCCGKE